MFWNLCITSVLERKIYWNWHFKAGISVHEGCTNPGQLDFFITACNICSIITEVFLHTCSVCLHAPSIKRQMTEVHISLQNFEVAPKLFENLWTSATHLFSVKKNLLCYMYVVSPQVVPFVRWSCFLVCRDSFRNMCTGNRELKFGSLDVWQSQQAM